MSNEKMLVSFLKDEDIGLESKDKLIQVLRLEGKSLGDGRCLCKSCLSSWVLEHFVDNIDGEYNIKPGTIATRK